MNTRLRRLAGAATAACTLIFAYEARGQNSAPPPPPPVPVGNPQPVIVAPPTLQQLAYAHQTARTGSYVTPPGEAYLGAAINPAISNAAVVTGVVAGSPAAQAGIVAGDTIVSLGNHRIDSPRDMNTVLRAMSPGAVIDVGVRRGRTTTAKVELGYAPRTGDQVIVIQQAQLPPVRR